MGSELVHLLMVSFPGQGHVNPLLRLAKRLASKGLFVTFSTTESFGRMLRKATDNTSPGTPTPIGKGMLRFEFFSDGWDFGDPSTDDLDPMMDRLAKAGPKAVLDLMARQAQQGRPVSFVINSPFLPWVLDVATSEGIPCAMLWVQSCTVLSVYYHYYHNKAKFPSSDEPDITLHLPGMPELTPQDLPSFLLGDELRYKSLKKVILDQFKSMEKACWVMVDSFHQLEKPVIESLSGVDPPIIPVGPLMKSIHGADSNSMRADMWKSSNCLEWLDLQPPASVIYISFGSIVVPEGKQMEEIASGIKNSGKRFLWAVKAAEKGPLPMDFLEETAERGKVVQWCPQEQVLSHPSIACFLTHCGWNSSLESLCSGIPVIAFPHFGDQCTNTKCLEEVYGTGVRLRRGNGSVVLKEEVERCIAEVMEGGPRAEEIKKNAMKWKETAAEAVADGGSSERSIQAIVEDIRRKSADVGVAATAICLV